MLPPIHKSTNGLTNERRGSGIGKGFLNDSNRKQAITTGLSSPGHVGHPENHYSGVLSAVGAPSSFSTGRDRMAERVHALERDNEHFHEELQHLRHFYSSNQQQHENEKLLAGKVAEDLQRLAHSFNSKLQADTSHQQREQQKAALLFAEIARLGHRVEGLESELKSVVNDTHRQIEAQKQHAQFMASVSSKQQLQAVSPTRNTELQRQLRDVQDAIVQLRSELDADRSTRWKNDAAIDAKLDAHLERLNSKLMADKRELARALDEQRQLVTGADFQRMTSHMREFSRVNDQLLALERWLQSEFGQIKRVFQVLAGNVDARFQCVLVELANGLKMWHAAQTRQEKDVRLRFQDLEEAVRAVATVVQRKLRTLEEVIPLEVQARQRTDDKLRRRVEGVVKALSHAIETSRGEYLPQQTILAQRVHQLELAQLNISDEVSMQHNAMRETIQAFMEDSNAMLVRLAVAVEQEHIKGVHVVTAREVEPLEMPHHIRKELEAETRRIREELSALEARTTLHEQECYQSRQTGPMIAPATAAPAVVQTRSIEEMRLESKHVEVELNALQSWAAANAQECCLLLQAAPSSNVMRTRTAGDVSVQTTSIREEVDALQTWTATHAQECRQFFDFLNSSIDDVGRGGAVMQCLDAVIDQIVETQACGHLNTLAMGVNGALPHSGVARSASAVTPMPAATTHGESKPVQPSHVQRTLKLPGQGYSQSAGDVTWSPMSEGTSDMLDLSTTTYNASTDEIDVLMDRVTDNDENGEEQHKVRYELTDHDVYAAGVVGSPSLLDERFSESMDIAQVNLLNTMGNGELGDDSATNSDTIQHTYDDGEDAYSMDTTHDEEINVHQPIIAHSSSIARQGQPPNETTRSPGPLNEALVLNQISQHNAVESHRRYEPLDEDELLTLDL